MAMAHGQTVFAPHLTHKNVRAGMEFYELSPETVRATTSLIGIFVPDPHAFIRKAAMAGGRELSPVKDYDYGYRQGTIIDPFGHHWLVEKKI